MRGERRCDPARHEEAERHRGIEVTARDVAYRRRHDRDREPVGQRDAGQVGVDGERAHPDEQKCEGADELGNIFGGLTSGCDASPSGGCLQKFVKK